MPGRAMIIVAAGSSSRFGADKMMSLVAGRPLLAHTVEAVAPHVDTCVVACRPDQIDALEAMGLPAVFVPGGASRTASEMAGLAVLGDQPDLIGIHDGARPLITGALIARLFAAAQSRGGAVPYLEPNKVILDRSTLDIVRGLGVVQTPQVFRTGSLMEAYVRAAGAGYEGHDTADVVLEFTSLTVTAVPGDPGNIKVTYEDDLRAVTAALE